jgi:hypothetical protein
VVGAGELAGVDEPDARARLGGELGVGKAVGHDDVGRVERPPAAERDEVGAARTRTDQGDTMAAGWVIVRGCRLRMASWAVGCRSQLATHHGDQRQRIRANPLG